MSPVVQESVRIPASLDELSGVHTWARERMETAEVPHPLRHNVLLALSESVTNAIRHGAGEDPINTVLIECTSEPGTIIFGVHDSGKGFSPETLPDPTEGNNLTKVGGRGVYLLKSLADAVRFDTSERGTSVRFTFEWNR